MLRILELIGKLFKYCIILTLIRLISTSVGLEFGVSRQYLRLLEWIFHLGKKRIEKVESKQRLHHQSEMNRPDNLDVQQDHLDEHSQLDHNDEAMNSDSNDNQMFHEKSRHSNHLANGRFAQENVRTDGRRNGFINPKLSTNNYEHGGIESKKISRRISTPDGPPVFLLDDYEDLDTSMKGDHQHEFHLIDPARLVVKGISAIIDDEVTKRFTPEELKTWNLLTRTNAKNYQFMSRSLGLCWLFGVLVRYLILLPLRIMFTIVGFLWLFATMSIVGLLPKCLRDKPYRLMSLMAFRMLSCGITSRLEFHNSQFKAKNGDICVANHTSPLDVVLLACDNCYALVGQRHGGLLGLLEFALSRATNHVWFDRGEMRDRQLVTQRLREHLSDKSNLPVLIFPEGTCINNSAVMMFRKGSFETTDRVCPVAIKYDPRFGDPFWNSSKQSYVLYLLMMMSSWAIKCDVKYLPPMDRLPGESSAEFANRVKAEIAKQGGLVDLAWDGQLKRSSIKPTWLHQQQEDYVQRLKLE